MRRVARRPCILSAARDPVVCAQDCHHQAFTLASQNVFQPEKSGVQQALHQSTNRAAIFAERRRDQRDGPRAAEASKPLFFTKKTWTV
jgi:hypothetical protein